jgi:hypothetical protein
MKYFLRLWLVFIVFASVSSPACIISYRNKTCVQNPTNYSLWYGSAPTAAGMLLGWYDRNGFQNLMPGGEAEICTYGNPNALINRAIASPGHINDYCRAGPGCFKDDLQTPTHSDDCLADFMGSNQDRFGNVNGETEFHFFTDNSPCTQSDLYNLCPFIYACDGMCGIGDYITYRGYQTSNLYNQLIYGYGGISAGFTFEQYKSQIDSNQGVLIHLINEFTGFTHTVYGYGYGYDNFGQILVNDSIGPNGQNPGYLSWGGYYFLDGQWLTQYGVTIVNLDSAPEPSTITLFLFASVLLRKHPNRKKF